MNIDQISSLARILAEYGLTSLEVDEGQLHIKMGRSYSPDTAAVQPNGADDRPAAVTSEKGGITGNSRKPDNLFEVICPIIGVFYAAPSPGAEPFTRVGAKVKKGAVLCLIETMKLMNEVLAERDGEITEMCVKDGEIAEYGRVLFRMRV